MSKNSEGGVRFQDDPDTLAVQFINTHQSGDRTIRFGGNAYVRDGYTWDKVFKGLAEGEIVQFINGKVQVWKKRLAAAQNTLDGFNRF